VGRTGIGESDEPDEFGDETAVGTSGSRERERHVCGDRSPGQQSRVLESDPDTVPAAHHVGIVTRDTHEP